jgi:hypothetical protein
MSRLETLFPADVIEMTKGKDEQMKHAKNFKDLTGVKIHRLTFLEFVDTTKDRNARWKVRCDCGTEFITMSKTVCCGDTQSCGCYRNEQIRKRFNNR